MSNSKNSIEKLPSSSRLERNNCWKNYPNQYPTSIHLNEDKFKEILKEGKIDVSNVIVD